MNKLILSIMFLFVSLSAALAQVDGKYINEIKLLKNEKWWGICLSDSPFQPFAAPFTISDAEMENSNKYMPIMLSSEGRYIWSSHPFSMEFDGEMITITSSYAKIEVRKSGRTLREAYLTYVHKNFPPSGSMPSADFFRLPVYETSNELGCAQGHEELVGYAERLIKEGFPVGIISICNGWSSLNSLDYEFDSELYPDPLATIEKLHSLGFKVMLTVSSYAPMAGRNYVNALRGGRIMVDKLKTEEPFSIVMPDMTIAAYYDMSNEQQADWFAKGLKKIKDEFPVDFFNFDCFMAMTLDLEKHDYDREKYMTNWMGLGAGMEHISIFRGGQKQPFTPYVTTVSNYIENKDGEVLIDKSTLGSLLSTSLLGTPYFNQLAAPEQFIDEQTMLHYMLLQCVMPVASVSVAPWKISDQKLHSHFRAAFDFRISIADYMENLVRESAKTAEPIVRHMEYQFPRNGFSDCSDQFMLGPKYLIAPCLDGASSRMVRLPKGRWIDKHGNKFRGPLVTQVNCEEGLIYFELGK